MYVQPPMKFPWVIIQLKLYFLKEGLHSHTLGTVVCDWYRRLQIHDMHVIARQISHTNCLVLIRGTRSFRHNSTLNIKKIFGQRRKSSSTAHEFANRIVFTNSWTHCLLLSYCRMEPTLVYPICFNEAKTFRKHGSSRCRPSSRHRRPPSQEKKLWEFG